MSRIGKAYEMRFRALLDRLHARRVEAGVQWLAARAERLGREKSLSPADALAQVYEHLAAGPAFRKGNPASPSLRFFCDAGLGGLARWLRAAGYEAMWRPEIDDDELLAEAAKLRATILTTDSMLMERRVLRDGVIPGWWLPPALGIAGQLALVVREFGLTPRAPRCMSCGGLLRRGDKEELRERIPPRTYRWLDEYFVCRSCGKLFWHGTHWRSIVDKLEKTCRQSSAIAESGRGEREATNV